MDNSIKGILASTDEGNSPEPHKNSSSALPPGTLKITVLAVNCSFISLEEDTEFASTGIEKEIVPAP